MLALLSLKQTIMYLFCRIVYRLFIALKRMAAFLKEGGVMLTLWALRACSYKTKAEAWHQGLCPPILFKGFILVFVIHK